VYGERLSKPATERGDTALVGRTTEKMDRSGGLQSIGIPTKAATPLRVLQTFCFWYSLLDIVLLYVVLEIITNTALALL